MSGDFDRPRVEDQWIGDLVRRGETVATGVRVTVVEDEPRGRVAFVARAGALKFGDDVRLMVNGVRLLFIRIDRPADPGPINVVDFTSDDCFESEILGAAIL